MAVLHPDDRDATLAAWAGAEAGNSFEVEHRLRGRDGKYSWFSSRAVPVRREDGSVLEWIGTANDVDALHQAQARQAVLVAELQHRTRNLIAVVRALAEKTIDCTSSIAEFEACFTDRLAALARVQALLSHVTAGRKVTFAELVRSELLALGGAVRGALDDCIRLAGPADVTLRSGAVQTLALAIHELATNALKYGALAGSGGRLSIGWAVEHSVDQPVHELVVRWIETGVTPPTIDERHARRGYGRELIEDALPFQLKALTHYAFTPDGVACVIRLPIVAEPEEQME